MKRLFISGFLAMTVSLTNAQFRGGSGMANDEKPASTLEAMSGPWR